MDILNLIVKQNIYIFKCQWAMVQLTTLVNKINARRCRNNFNLEQEQIEMVC